MRFVPFPSVCPDARVNRYVIVVAVLLLLWRICPPTVLNCPLELTPVVRWMTIVMESEVITPVLSRRMASSLNQGPFALISGVTVTPPFPTSFTVRLIDVVRVRPPPVPVTVTVAGPSVAVLDAVRLRTLLAPVVEDGLKLAVTPLGKPLALRATLLVKPPVLVIVIVLVPLAPRLIVRLEGFGEREKSGVAGWFTVRLIVVVRVRLPPVPVTVTVADPSVAVVEAARVSTLLVPVVEVGLKLAVTPVGNPLALNATLLVKPPVRVIVIVLVPLAPRLIVRLEGLGEREKSGVAGWFTVRLIVVVRVRLPSVPVTVTVAGPSVAVVEAARVSTLLVPVVEVGLKLAVTPVGNPLALNATLLVKPPVRVTVIVLVPLAPRLIVRLEGLGEREKSGVAGWFTVRLIVVVRVRPPPVPVTVTVAGPRVAVLEAVKVRTLLVPVVEVGLKLAVTPVGNPLALNATLPVKPPLRVIVIVLVPLAPRLIVRLEGFGESAKSGLTVPLRSP